MLLSRSLFASIVFTFWIAYLFAGVSVWGSIRNQVSVSSTKSQDSCPPWIFLVILLRWLDTLPFSSLLSVPTMNPSYIMDAVCYADMFVMQRWMQSWTKTMPQLLVRLANSRPFVLIEWLSPRHWFRSYVLILALHLLCGGLQRLYVTLFPCNECAKVIIQVWAFLPHKSSFLLHGNQLCYTYSNGFFPHCRNSVFFLLAGWDSRGGVLCRQRGAHWQ